jgi:hypothetical protein
MCNKIRNVVLCLMFLAFEVLGVQLHSRLHSHTCPEHLQYFVSCEIQVVSISNAEFRTQASVCVYNTLQCLALAQTYVAGLQIVS